MTTPLDEAEFRRMAAELDKTPPESRPDLPSLAEFAADAANPQMPTAFPTDEKSGARPTVEGQSSGGGGSGNDRIIDLLEEVVVLLRSMPNDIAQSLTS